jgi:hypothetical protein
MDQHRLPASSSWPMERSVLQLHAGRRIPDALLHNPPFHFPLPALSHFSQLRLSSLFPDQSLSLCGVLWYAGSEDGCGMIRPGYLRITESCLLIGAQFDH